MLFGFRGIRAFQVILSIAALLCGVGAVISLKVFADDRTWIFLPAAMVLGLLFLWLFSTTLRAPTSLLAVDLGEKRLTRIRFAGFVDTVIDNRDILGVRLRHTNILNGVGIRTNFGGDVGLFSAWGPAAELTLRNPIRIWLVPRLIPVRARRLTLSIRNPEKLVAQFAQVSSSPATSSPAAARPAAARRRGKR